MEKEEKENSDFPLFHFFRLLQSCFFFFDKNNSTKISSVIFSRKGKKGIGPLIAIMLLLVVIVVAVFGFQTWFQSYQKSLQATLEVKTNSGVNALDIIDLNEGSLYVVNTLQDNLSVTSLKIGGNYCAVTSSLSLGMNDIPISSCLYGLLSDTYEVVLRTDTDIISKKFYLKNGISALNCPAGYIAVPGSATYFTSSFCVMKYEAKNDGGVANSTATGTPWVSLTWQQAIANCTSLGSGYHLVTENEWLTIANNVLLVANNWNSSVVGTGFLYSGHNDNSPSNALAADSDDGNGYYGTNDGASSPGDGVYDNFLSNDPRAYQGQKRTLILSNGEVIWDFAGNVWEWVNESFYANATLGSPYPYHGGDQQWMSYSSNDGTGKIASNVPALKLPINGWNADEGMGRYLDGMSLTGTYNSINEDPDFCTGYCSQTAVFSRSGDWDGGLAVGALTLNFDIGPSATDPSGGFRCAYTLS